MTTSSMAGDIVNCLPQLRRYALALTYNADDAADLVQDCVARILSKCPSWDTVRQPRAYLFSALHNAHADRMKSTRLEREILCDSLDLNGEPSHDPTILHDLGRALNILPKDQRDVVLLVGVEGLSYREVAHILRIPLGTVMSRLSRGRESLRAFMNGDGATLAIS